MEQYLKYKHFLNKCEGRIKNIYLKGEKVKGRFQEYLDDIVFLISEGFMSDKLLKKERNELTEIFSYFEIPFYYKVLDYPDEILREYFYSQWYRNNRNDLEKDWKGESRLIKISNRKLNEFKEAYSLRLMHVNKPYLKGGPVENSFHRSGSIKYKKECQKQFESREKFILHKKTNKTLYSYNGIFMNYQTNCSDINVEPNPTISSLSKDDMSKIMRYLFMTRLFRSLMVEHFNLKLNQELKTLLLYLTKNKLDLMDCKTNVEVLDKLFDYIFDGTIIFAGGSVVNLMTLSRVILSMYKKTFNNIEKPSYLINSVSDFIKHFGKVSHIMKKENLLNYGDIDLFFVNANDTSCKEKNIKKINLITILNKFDFQLVNGKFSKPSVITAYRNNNLDRDFCIEPKSDEKDNDKFCSISRTRSSITLNRKVQFILRLYSDIEQVLMGFDIAASSVGFDGKDFFMTPLAEISLRNRVIIPFLDQYSTSTTYRICKYAKHKNFSIYIPGVSNINKYVKVGNKGVPAIANWYYSDILPRKISDYNRVDDSDDYEQYTTFKTDIFLAKYTWKDDNTINNCKDLYLNNKLVQRNVNNNFIQRYKKDTIYSNTIGKLIISFEGVKESFPLEWKMSNPGEQFTGSFEAMTYKDPSLWYNDVSSEEHKIDLNKLIRLSEILIAEIKTKGDNTNVFLELRAKINNSREAFEENLNIRSRKRHIEENLFTIEGLKRFVERVKKNEDKTDEEKQKIYDLCESIFELRHEAINIEETYNKFAKTYDLSKYELNVLKILTETVIDSSLYSRTSIYL